MPVGFSSNGQVEAPLVFAGYGITDAELKYDDYPSAVKGRIALAFSGTPDGDNPHGEFARYEDVRWKAIAAHNDHLGRGGEGSLAPREGEIHHGADDNASGVAGLIELARMLSTQNQKPRRTIVFIAFSGEEEGLIGSSYYVNHPVVPLQNTVAMINMDMIGRLKEKKLIVGGVGTAQEWRSMVDADNSVQGMTVSLNAPRREAVATGKGPI